jgi:Dolichyl-phosphate-mannose-protein mannosyltransferase
MTAVLAFTAAGLLVVALVPGLFRRPVLARFGYAYLFGSALVGVALYAGSFLFSFSLSRASIRAIVWSLAAAGVAASLVRVCVSVRRPPRKREPLAIVAVAAFAVGALVSMGLFADALTNVVNDWDGRQTWCVQARYLRGAGTVNAPVLRDPATFVSNPRYPVLMPLLQVTALELAGAEDDDRAFRPLYAAFYPAFLLVLYDGASRLAGRRAAALATLVAAVVPDLPFWPYGGANGTYSDVPLASFCGAGLLLLLHARRSPALGAAAGLLFSAAVLTKAEGLPLALAAVFLCAARTAFSPRRDLGRALPLALCAALVLSAGALYLSWRSHIPARFDQGYAGFFRDISALRKALPNLGQAAPVMVRHMFDWGHWGLLWAIVPLFVIASPRALRHPAARPLLAAFAAPLALGCAAYSLHFDPAAIAAATWDRFLIQGAMPLFLFFALFVKRALPDQGFHWKWRAG